MRICYDDGVTFEERWEKLNISAFNTAAKVLGRAERKHQDLFDDNDANKAKSKALQRRIRRSTDRLAQARSKLQKYSRGKEFSLVGGKSRITSTGS